MSYTTYDFEESLKQAEGFSKEDVQKCLFAWGGSPEGGGSWEGGFLLLLKDGRYAYLAGWCDYTGWGCQDGVSTTIFSELPNLSALKIREKGENGWIWDEEPSGWDENPADLNRYLRGEVSAFD